MFPIEWLLLENIRCLEKIDLDIEEMRIIRDTYKQLLNEELRGRHKIEEKITKNLIEKGVKNIKDKLAE